MARLSRYTQLIFGSNAGATQIAEFGSLAAGAPLTFSGATITPTIVQTLSNYLSGWFAAVTGANSPAIEDMNALFYLITYQLSYGFQSGVPEWDSATTYFSGSMVNDGAGNLFVSLTNTNLNHVLTDATNWKPYSAANNVVAFNPGTQSPYTLTAADIGKTFLINSANGASQFNLPAAVLNFKFAVKDVAGSLPTNNVTIHRAAAESVENVAADYVFQAAYGELTFACDGTNWFIIGR